MADLIGPELLAAQIRENQYDALQEYAQLIESYAHSIGEAAWRREEKVLELHIKQIALVTRELIDTFKGVREIEKARAKKK